MGVCMCGFVANICCFVQTMTIAMCSMCACVCCFIVCVAVCDSDCFGSAFYRVWCDSCQLLFIGSPVKKKTKVSFHFLASRRHHGHAEPAHAIADASWQRQTTLDANLTVEHIAALAVLHETLIAGFASCLANEMTYTCIMKLLGSFFCLLMPRAAQCIA